MLRTFLPSRKILFRVQTADRISGLGSIEAVKARRPQQFFQVIYDTSFYKGERSGENKTKLEGG